MTDIKTQQAQAGLVERLSAVPLHARFIEEEWAYSRLYPVGRLCHEAIKEIRSLKEQLEVERMRLAACGVAALENTRTTLGHRIEKTSPFWSDSYEQACRAVDREISHREKLVEVLWMLVYLNQCLEYVRLNHPAVYEESGAEQFAESLRKLIQDPLVKQPAPKAASGG